MNTLRRLDPALAILQSLPPEQKKPICVCRTILREGEYGRGEISHCPHCGRAWNLYTAIVQPIKKG